MRRSVLRLRLRLRADVGCAIDELHGFVIQAFNVSKDPKDDPGPKLRCGILIPAIVEVREGNTFSESPVMMGLTVVELDAAGVLIRLQSRAFPLCQRCAGIARDRKWIIPKDEEELNDV